MSSETYGNSYCNSNKVMTCVENHCAQLPTSDMVIYTQSHNASNISSGSKHVAGNSKLQKRRTSLRNKSGNLSTISALTINVIHNDASVRIQEIFFPYPSVLYAGGYEPINFRHTYYIPSPTTNYEYQHKLNEVKVRLVHVLTDPMVNFVQNLTNVAMQRENGRGKSCLPYKSLTAKAKYKICEDAFAQYRPICVVVYACESRGRSDNLCHSCCKENKQLKAMGTSEIIDYLSLTQATAQPIFRLNFKLPLLTVDSNERFVIFGFCDRLVIFSALTLQPMLTLHNRPTSPYKMIGTSAPCDCGNSIQKTLTSSKQQSNPFALKHGSWVALTETHLNTQLESGSNPLNTLGLRSGYLLGCGNAQPIDQQCSSTIYKAAKGVSRALTNLSETAYGLASSSRCLLDSVLTDKSAPEHTVKTSSNTEKQRALLECPLSNVITIIDLDDILSSYQGFHYTTNVTYGKADNDTQGVTDFEEWSVFCCSPTDSGVKCGAISNKLGHNANAVGPLVMCQIAKRVSVSSPHKLVQNFLNVPSHLPLNRSSLVCHFKGVGGSIALSSHNLPLNLKQASYDVNGPKVESHSITGHFDTLKYNVGDPENIIYMQFNPESTLLFVAGDKGREFQLYYIGPHAGHDPTLTRVVHLYRLHRGLSPCKELRMVDFSDDSRWLSVTTENDTTHLFAINSYGGGGGVAKFETHGRPKVFNECAGDFIRSAGLDSVPLNISALRSKEQNASSQKRLNRSSRLYKAVMAVPISRMAGSLPHKIQALERLKSYQSPNNLANPVKGSFGSRFDFITQQTPHSTCTNTNTPICSQTRGLAELTRAGVDFGLSALKMNPADKRDVSAVFAPSIYYYGRDGREIVPSPRDAIPDFTGRSDDYSYGDSIKEDTTTSSMLNDGDVEWMGLDACEFEEPGRRQLPTPDQTNLLGTQDLDLKGLKEYLIYGPDQNLLTLRCSPLCSSRRPKMVVPSSVAKLSGNSDSTSHSPMSNSLYVFDAHALTLSEYVLDIEPPPALSNLSTPNHTPKVNNQSSEGILGLVQPLSTCSLLQSMLNREPSVSTTSSSNLKSRKEATLASHLKLNLKREWSVNTDHMPAHDASHGGNLNRDTFIDTDRDMIIVEADFDVAAKLRSKDSRRLIKSTPPAGSAQGSQQVPRPSVKSNVGVSSFLSKWSTPIPTSRNEDRTSNESRFLKDEDAVKKESFMDDASQWMSEVEVRTYAGPHRRIWMGPQFAFKTFQPHCHTTILQAQSPALLSAAKIKGDTSCELPNKVKVCPEFRNSGKTDEPFDLLTFCDEDTSQALKKPAPVKSRDNSELLVLQAFTDNSDVDNLTKPDINQSLTDDILQAINTNLLSEPAKINAAKAKARVSDPEVISNLRESPSLSVNSKSTIPLENILAEATDDQIG